jgi:uncharacterized protein (TIGR02147 family)
MQTIFHFDDAIEYLQHRFLQAKKLNSRVSVRSWALRLGFKHSMTLSRILKRDRRLTIRQAQKIGEKLGLKESELKYFELLAQANQTDNTELFKKYHELTLNHKQIPNTMTLKEFKCFAQWLTGPLLESLSLQNTKHDLESVVIRFSKHAKAVEIRELVQILCDVGLIQKTQNGTFEITPNRKNVLNIHSLVREAAIENYLAGQIEQSVKAFETMPVGKRKMTSASIAISAEQVPQAKKIIDDAVQKLLQLTKQNNADLVYQFNAQFFPVVE